MASFCIFNWVLCKVKNEMLNIMVDIASSPAITLEIEISSILNTVCTHYVLLCSVPRHSQWHRRTTAENTRHMTLTLDGAIHLRNSWCFITAGHHGSWLDCCGTNTLTKINDIKISQNVFYCKRHCEPLRRKIELQLYK